LFIEFECHVHIHGYGKTGPLVGPPQAGWYIAMVTNGVVRVNVSHGTPQDTTGFFTYILHPDSCTVSDYRHWDTFNAGSTGSANLISYLQALSDGKRLLGRV